MKNINEVNKIANKLLFENNNDNSKLYHQTKPDFEILKSIIENGLQPNDNGEAYGVWFQANTPFYSSQSNMFSIENNSENLTKYKFSILYDGDVKIATRPIPFNELTVENIGFAVSNNQNILFSKFFTNSNKLIQKRVQEYGSIAKYMCENKNFETLLVYTDLFEMFIEQGTSHIFDEYEHVITKKLLD
jgi:hypothetical protein